MQAIKKHAKTSEAVALAGILMVPWALGCTPQVATGGQTRPAPRAASASSSGATPVVLGTIDGEPVRPSDLQPQTRRRLRKLENEHKQRRMHLLWSGFEETLAHALLEREAERRGITVEALLKKEAFVGLEKPTDEEIRGFYEDNADVFKVPFEVVAPHIRKEMLAQRRQKRRRAYVEQLRRAADVRRDVPVPQLPRFDVPSADAPARGPEDAAVTIVEFADYQCPYCARAKDVLSRLQKQYPDDVRLVYRDFPLDQHPHAQRAAEAAHCAGEQDEFWAYHDRLFASSSALSEEDLQAYAEELALDMDAFMACLASERPSQAVAASKEQAMALGVEGTPAIYINGIKLIGLLPMPLLESLVENELK